MEFLWTFKASLSEKLRLEKVVHRRNGIQKAKELDPAADICVCLRLEESFIFSPSAQRGRRIDDDCCIG